MSRPIILYTPTRVSSTDDAGLTIIKSVLAPSTSTTAPYSSSSTTPSLRYVPSLVWFCLRRLLTFADQIHVVASSRLTYHTSNDCSYDLLHALIPSLSSPTFSLRTLDPRLWALLVQIYPSSLPAPLSSSYPYPIPLSDPHLPSLQRIPSSAHFSLVTVLTLPSCGAVTDEAIHALRALHTLAALDVSKCLELSAYGVAVLVRGMTRSEEDRALYGPWGLRILRLRGCGKVDNTVYSALVHFPLLNAVDLRGTRCTPRAVPNRFAPAPSTELALYHPTPITTSLSSLPPSSFSSPHVHTLLVDALDHPSTAILPSTPDVKTEDTYVVFSSSHTTSSKTKAGPNTQMKSRMRVGTAHVFEEQERIRNGGSRPPPPQRERVKDAWYGSDSEEYCGYAEEVVCGSYYGLECRCRECAGGNDECECRDSCEEGDGCLCPCKECVERSGSMDDEDLSEDEEAGSSGDDATLSGENILASSHTALALSEEAESMSSFQTSARTFYTHLPPLVRIPRAPSPEYGDKRLMLWRSPPRWDVLEDLAAGKSNINISGNESGNCKGKRRVEVNATFDSQSKKAQEGIKALADYSSAKRQKLLSQPASASGATALKSQPEPVTPRNPFRRKSAPAPPAPAPKEMQKVGIKRSLELKPISTLPVPVLPKESREKMENERRKIVSALKGKERERVKVDVKERQQMMLPRMLKVTPCNPESVGKKDGKGAAGKRVKGMGTGKGKAGAGFDWEGWGER